METDTPRPGHDDAREALELAKRSEAAARHPSLPRWWFPLMAAVVAAVMAAQMLDPAARVPLLGAAVVVMLAANRHAQTSAGIVWDATRVRGQVPFLVTVLGVVVATAVAVATTGDERLWAGGAAAAAVVVLLAGLLYARTGAMDD